MLVGEFKPKNGQMYWYYGRCDDVNSAIWSGTEDDLNHFRYGNCYESNP